MCLAPNKNEENLEIEWQLISNAQFQAHERLLLTNIEFEGRSAPRLIVL